MLWLENFLKCLNSRMTSFSRICLKSVTLCVIIVTVRMFSSARVCVCVCVCVTKHLAH